MDTDLLKFPREIVSRSDEINDLIDQAQWLCQFAKEARIRCHFNCNHHRQPCLIEVVLKPRKLEIFHLLEKSTPEFKKKFGFIERIEEVLAIERRKRCLDEKNP